MTDMPGDLSATAHWLRGLDSLTGTAPPFPVAGAPDDPVDLFLGWIRQAAGAGVAEPHGATLSTVGADGIPDARTLIVKDVSSEGWSFAGPAVSEKAAQLAAHPAAALTFWWPPVLRAVRLRGAVAPASPAAIEADFAARPSTGSLTAADWMLWRLRPSRVEFWQGATSRDHTRLFYERSGEGWTHRASGDPG